MNDQLHEDRAAIKDLPPSPMSKTFLQLRFESDDLKELLQDDQSGKRRQALIFEPQLRDGVLFCAYAFSATLHLQTSLFCALVVARTNINREVFFVSRIDCLIHKSAEQKKRIVSTCWQPSRTVKVTNRQSTRE
jgi:hypothetical protein